jgi:hypothetical protein
MDLEGSRRLEGLNKTSVRTAVIAADIRTQDFPNTHQEQSARKDCRVVKNLDGYLSQHSAGKTEETHEKFRLNSR